jgi:hypothetical protein
MRLKVYCSSIQQNIKSNKATYLLKEQRKAVLIPVHDNRLATKFEQSNLLYNDKSIPE